MRTPRLSLAAALSLVLGASAALAGPGSISAGATGGTLGFGPEIAYRLGPLGVRANAGFLAFSHEQELDGIDYRGDFNLMNVGAMADWYPFIYGFRISAGARWNGSDIDLSARPASNVSIGGATYTPAEIGRLRGTLDASPIAPVVSLGFSGNVLPRFTLSAELGVMYQGKPNVSDLRAVGGLLEDDPSLFVDLKAEERRIERDLDAYRIWPVAQLMMVYRF